MEDLINKPILIVDDNITDQLLLSHQLKSLGFNNIKFGINWLDAVQKTQAQLFDIILMDINMPIKNWLDAAQEIRNLPNGQHPKIITYTANSYYKDSINQENKEIFDWEIMKPAATEKISDEIKKVFSK